MITLRLTGLLNELADMLLILEQHCTVIKFSKPIKNHNSKYHRIYVEVTLK